MEPLFRRWADGRLNLTDTPEVTKVKDIIKVKPWMRPMSPESVLNKARKALFQQRGDPANRKHQTRFLQNPVWCVSRTDIQVGGWKCPGVCCFSSGSNEEGPHRRQQRFPRPCPQQEVFQGVYWALSSWQNCQWPWRKSNMLGRLPSTLPPPNTLPLTLSAPWLGNCLTRKAWPRL